MGVCESEFYAVQPSAARSASAFLALYSQGDPSASYAVVQMFLLEVMARGWDQVDAWLMFVSALGHVSCLSVNDAAAADGCTAVDVFRRLSLEFADGAR